MSTTIEVQGPMPLFVTRYCGPERDDGESRLLVCFLDANDRDVIIHVSQIPALIEALKELQDE